MNTIERDYVAPFYLSMMGCNALSIPDSVFSDLVETGRTVLPSDVTWMLRVGVWRPVVMGAWFSLACPEDEIRDDLRRVTSQSHGSLTAPPLVAVASLVAGHEAVPYLTDHLNRITVQSQQDGSEEFIAAAIKRLGGVANHVTNQQEERAFADLFEFAERLRNAWASPVTGA